MDAMPTSSGVSIENHKVVPGQNTAYPAQASLVLDSLPVLQACWPLAFCGPSASLPAGRCTWGHFSHRFPPPSALRPPPSATARRRRRPAGPAPAPAKGAAKAKPGAPRSPGTRPPSRRWAPNGRAALGPSASPHVAPPHAALSLAVARPSGPAPLLEAGQTAPQPGAGLEVNGPE